MQLISYEFPFFLGILLLLYYLLPGCAQWVLLLAGSWVFYAFPIGGTAVFPVAGQSPGTEAVGSAALAVGSVPFACGCLLLTILSTWVLGLRIEAILDRGEAEAGEKGLRGKELRQYRETFRKKAGRWLTAGLILNFGILAILKLLHALPLGISYFTFQSASYMIDISRGKERAERNPFRYALFISFFPQLVQGPISRKAELSPQLREVHRLSMPDMEAGLLRMLWGYWKKLLIADRLSPLVAALAADPSGFRGAYAWLSMLSYTLWMYADFTGGIDIVLGMARLFGINLPENFDHPFFSRSLAEFWQKWHMSLMRWFREYIFYPLSMSRAAARLSSFCRTHFGKGAARRAPLYFSSLTVWLLTGIWHGASWGFVLWGLSNGVVLLLSQEFELLSQRMSKRGFFSSLLKGRGKDRAKQEGKTEAAEEKEDPAKKGKIEGRGDSAGKRKIEDKEDPAGEGKIKGKGNPAGSFWDAFRVLRTIVIFSMLEMFEYYPVSLVPSLWASLFFSFRLTALFEGSFPSYLLSMPEWMLLVLSVLLMIASGFVSRRIDIVGWFRQRPWFVRYLLLYGLFLSVLIFGAYGHGYDAASFVYNQY